MGFNLHNVWSLWFDIIVNIFKKKIKKTTLSFTLEKQKQQKYFYLGQRFFPWFTLNNINFSLVKHTTAKYATKDKLYAKISVNFLIAINLLITYRIHN